PSPRLPFPSTTRSRSAVVSCRGLFADGVHPGLDEVQRGIGEGANGAAYRGVGRDYVVGRAAVNLGDAQYRRVEPIAVAGDDGLHDRQSTRLNSSHVKI